MNLKINSELRLEVRKNTKKYQAVIKSPSDGKWRRLSTGSEDIEQATEFARDKLAEWKVLEKRGLSESGYSFEHAAKQYLKVLQLAIDSGTATDSQVT